ncbi:DUF47 domain-containing protein [Candidatus Bipolaricaulota bacterium]|nr:DUF47 domain-containing protein [Candidatus Bipolaricaulota bacterium]
MAVFNGKKIKKIFKRALTESSPFEQLNDHAQKVNSTVEALVKEIRAYSEGEEINGEKVSSLEYEADKLKQKIRQELPRSDLFMPVARSDVLSLLWHQDEIADNSQDVAELLPLLKLKSDLPAGYKTTLTDLADILEEAVGDYETLVKESGEIIMGRKSSSDDLHRAWDIVKRINNFEHEADKSTRKGIKVVYNDDSLREIEKYHLIQIALKINNTLDHIENAGNFIRIMTHR